MSVTDPAGGDPIAWQEIRERTPVLAVDGTTVGRVSEVLGSEEEDVFHGVEVRLTGRDRAVLVVADDVTRITALAVTVGLTSAEVDALPPHTEEHAFKLGWKGIIRKHPGWVEEKDWGR